MYLLYVSFVGYARMGLAFSKYGGHLLSSKNVTLACYGILLHLIFCGTVHQP